MDKFKANCVFKFESPRAKDLQGAELWTKNFIAAATGDINKLGTHFELVRKALDTANTVEKPKIEEKRTTRVDGEVKKGL
jgi:hypothetical protein